MFRPKQHLAIWKKAFLLIMLISVFVGCSGSNSELSTIAIVSFSDVHFTPLYDTTLFDDLVAASVDGWASIFQSSADTDPSTWGEETNYVLFMAAGRGWVN